MADAFFQTLCEPFEFGPYVAEDSFITLCFTDLLLILLTVLLFLLFGVIRFWQVSRRSHHHRPYTKAHWFELVLCGLNCVLPLANLIYTVVAWNTWGHNAPFPWFKYVTTGGLFLTWFCALVLCEKEYTHGLKHGWVLISFWVISAVLSGLRVQAYVNEQSFDGPVYFILIELISAVLLSFNALLNNRVPPATGEEIPDYNSDFSLSEVSSEQEGAILLDDEKEDNYGVIQIQDVVERPSEQNANILSRLTYWWLNSLLVKGYRNQLQYEDMPRLMDIDTAKKQNELFEEAWSLDSENDKRSLFRTLVRIYGWEFAWGGFLKVLNDASIFTGPLFLQYIILFIQDPEAPFWHGLLLAFGMFAGRITELVAVNAYFQVVFRINMKVKSALMQAIYSKTLRLATNGSPFTTGEIVTLQGIDTKKVGETITYLHNVWSAPVQIFVSIGLLFQVLSWASFAGLGILVITLPINLVLYKYSAEYQKEIMTLRSKRAKQTNECLQGIRVIKFFAWEESNAKIINTTRNTELDFLRKSAYLRAVMMFMWGFIPVLVAMVSFAIYMGMGYDLTAEVAFTSLSLYNVMRFPLNILPNVITSVIAASVSIERIETLLLGKELDAFAVEEDFYMDDRITVKGGTFQWKDGVPVLHDISFTAGPKELVAIVGEVGSGKSSLIQALLGEIPKVSGRVCTKGRVAYVPQQAWMQNATVKANIIFGRESEQDDKRYRNTIKMCELEHDLSVLPAGERTEIGEKGINLSGGQKQRISLARAVYSDADIYLMDDPLSALDAHVGKNIFDNCIVGALKGKCRILVTHQLQHLHKCDKIILLHEGSIKEMGTYQQLMDLNGEFKRLIATHTTEVKEDEKVAEEKAEKKSDGEGKITEKEKGQKGSVSGSVYWAYVKELGGPFWVGLILLFSVLSTVADMGTNYWLSYWSSQSNSTDSNSSSVMAFETFVVNIQNNLQETNEDRWFYFQIYALLGLGVAVFAIVQNILVAYATLRSSKHIHESMLQHTLRSPMSFFDTTPVGRILNRMNSDIAAVDEELPRVSTMAIRTVLTVISILVIIGSVTPIFLLLLIPLSFLYRYVQRFYLNSSREIQRLESMSKSPIYSLFAETLNGCTTIRAYGRQDDLTQLNQTLTQTNQECYNAWFSSNRWLSLRLEFVGSVVVFGASFFTVLGRGTGINAGAAGLAITYSLQLTSFLNWMVRMNTEVENAFVSVERCVEYGNLTVEAPPILAHRPASSWPQKGSIIMENVSLRYREGLPLVLKNVTCEINPREKIGIVGRTGAGKSSLMLVLFRLVELATGRVVIDGEDISQIGLDDLRSKLAIIPQEPTLFTGTVRSNLDPFSQYTDQELWDALEACSLTNQIAKSKGLDSEITEGGANLSVGTRQLVCLGRALLRKSRILVMDEATASVDYETDHVIQKTIKREFANCTVLTIAHRINTILESDRVMVLDAGQIVEFDSPKSLLANPNTVFYSLANNAGATLGKTQ